MWMVGTKYILMALEFNSVDACLLNDKIILKFCQYLKGYNEKIILRYLWLS